MSFTFVRFIYLSVWLSLYCNFKCRCVINLDQGTSSTIRVLDKSRSLNNTKIKKLCFETDNYKPYNFKLHSYEGYINQGNNSFEVMFNCKRWIQSEMLSIIVAVFFVCCQPTISLVDREHKYVPKVNLLKSKGFSITIEGSNTEHLSLMKSGKFLSKRSKREVNIESNNTDVSQGKYGSLGIFCNNEINRKRLKTFVNVKDIDSNLNNKFIQIRGHIQTSRARGKQCFIILRQQQHTIQCLLRVGPDVSRKMLKFATNISRESVVDIGGKVQMTSMEIRSCTVKWSEIIVNEIWLVSPAEVLPVQVIDCARPEGLSNSSLSNIYVSMDKKLDNRVLDLRTPANQAIFRLESVVTQTFRDALVKKGFIEIHTPKIISAASEGGASVFTVSYFKTFAYLAQSPQLYKQMAIAADFNKVFTVGAVFRAEESDTARHLTEYVGLDLEMAFKYDYHEVLDVIEQTFIEIFQTLQQNFSSEILTVREQYQSEPFVFIDPPPRILFSEAITMLKEAGFSLLGSELTHKDEKSLGSLIKKKYNTDFFVLDKYPTSVRPFYTMPDHDDPTISNSYDVFMRGEEVMSGAQRIHDYSLLRKSALQHGIDLDKIKAYLDAFRFGCPPHAGGGIGLERTVALFLGLDNIRKTSMFPRDPKRLTP